MGKILVNDICFAKFTKVSPPEFCGIWYTLNGFYLPSQMTIETDDMDLAGDVIQSLASYLDIMVIYYDVCLYT